MEGLEQYNAVNKENFVFPQYDLTKKETGITLYFNSQGDVIIVGRVDHYIFWLSVTKTEDVIKNEQIFKRIAEEPLGRVSYLHRILPQQGLTYEELETYYQVHLKRSHEPNIAWETPFGHSYGKKQTKRNGSFFAQDVKDFVREVNKRCEIRECGGNYVEILKQYAQLLKEATEYNYTVQMLQNLLKQEDYLCISSKEEVRRLYLECCRKCGELYQQYIEKAR